MPLPKPKPPGLDGNPPPYTPVEDLAERCAKAERELEQCQKQFGVCSVCGYAAWKNRDATTEECQYCALQSALSAAEAERDSFRSELLRLRDIVTLEDVESIDAVLNSKT